MAAHDNKAKSLARAQILRFRGVELNCTMVVVNWEEGWCWFRISKTGRSYGTSRFPTAVRPKLGFGLELGKRAWHRTEMN